MKSALITICSFIGILEFLMIIIYFVTFNEGISTTNQDWDTFIQIFNGLTMTILTATNIYVFYRLTVVVEDKNQERSVREKVFEAQSVLTQMRVKQYEDVKTLIYKVIEMVAQDKSDNGEMTLLYNKIAELEESFLFKNYDLKDSSILGDESDKVRIFIRMFKTDANNVDKEAFIKSLITCIKLLELYIIGQMVTTDKDVAKYVQENTKNIDCSISCAVQIFDKTIEIIKDLDLTKEGA